MPVHHFPGLQLERRAAIRAQNRACLAHIEKYARMRIPRDHLGGRAMQRQVGGGHFYATLFIVLLNHHRPLKFKYSLTSRHASDRGRARSRNTFFATAW